MPELQRSTKPTSRRPLPALVALVSLMIAGPSTASAETERIPVDLAAKSTRATLGAKIDHILYAKNVVAGTKVMPRPDLTGPRPKMATFEVDFVGFTPAARAALQAAVDLWSTALDAPVPIRIQAFWTTVFPDGSGDPIPTNVLGATAEPFLRDQGALPPGIWFPDALANQIVGSDVFPAEVEILIILNSGFPNWYLGTDGNAGPSEFDLVTVALHEIGHGLGMTGVMRVIDSGPLAGEGEWLLNGNATNLPSIYDTFAEVPNGDKLADQSVFPNPSVALGNALQSNVLFDGPSTTGVLGSRPPLFTPTVFQAGSSYAHFDENSFPFGNPDSLMTPQLALGEVIHDPGDLFLCLLEDLGWNTVASCDGNTGGTCQADDDTFCLQGDRFAVEVDWRVPDGRTGVGRRVSDSPDSGLFYFFNPNNWEMLVKVLDACDLASNRFWVFAAATTNVEYTLTVTDTVTDTTVSYFNPQGRSAAAITDTSAFDTCP